MQLDVMTVGDALIDIFLMISSANEHCRQSEQTHEMCFTIGAKIPVDDCQFFLGGNACNTAVGFSRLGLRVGIVAETGDDEFSKKIIYGLQKERVALDYLKQTPNTQASFAIDLTCMNDRTIFSRHVKRSHDIAFENATCSYIYLTSLGDEWKSLYEKVFIYVQDKQVQLAFNPGSKQLKEGKDSFQQMLGKTTIFFVNKEEAEDIVYGTEKVTEEQKKPEELLRAVQKLGPKIVSITDGDKGSYTIDEQGSIFFQGTVPGAFVQKTGVGDSYAAGFLGARIQGKNIQEAMLWGATNASSVIEHIGAQTGLLTKEQLEERIKKLNAHVL